ncbi:MAG TPA: IS110 family transposase [Candidatus Acidoferrales bacterium]|nr:IS110 family transposase [Candidatus Acidoferrales bacterium]
MKIIGCDYHPSYQQIAMLDDETGELWERQLEHETGEARRFYESLEGPVRVGIEAVGNSQWFEKLLGDCGHELWIGDAGEIRRLVGRRQKTDRRDALHILQLLRDGRFPRLWVPSAEVRDVRQLLRHRQKLVGIRTQVKNQLQHLALNQGVRRRNRLWSKQGRRVLEQLPLTGWTARRRTELLEMLDRLERQVGELDEAVKAEAERRPEVRLLMTHPGVGPVVGLAYVLTLGPVSRFRRGKHVASYLGLIPSEKSSGGRQRLGSISKQGNTMMRTLLVEAAQTASRGDAELRREYRRLAARKHTALAKVMVARKLAVRMYWMLRENRAYSPRPVAAMQGSPSHSVVAG